jgi:hypothetical protein
VAANTNNLATTTQYANQSTVAQNNILNQNSMASNFTGANTFANGATMALNNAATTSLANQSTLTNTYSNALVSQNLSYLQANQLLLQTNLTTNQVNSLFQIFTGNQSNSVSNAASFPVVTPACL